MNRNRKARRISGSFRLESLEKRQMLSGGANFDGGAGNAFAIASDGTLYLAYYVPTDSTHGTLRYAIRNSSGVWSADQLLDNSSAQVGLYPSMALDSTGKPAVAYFDGVNADLRYAHYNGTTWDTGIVYSTLGKRGNYPSLAFLSDKPTITHYVKTGTSSGFLAVDQASTVNPSSPGSWTTTTIDSSGNAGRYSSLVYNSALSKWGVSYDDSGTSIGARYVETSGSSVTSGWGTVATIPIPTGTQASNAVWTSLVYDSSGRPAFAWYDNTDAAVNFAHRNGTGSTPWNSLLIDNHNTTGKYPDLIYESNQFRLAYFDESGGRTRVTKGGDTSGGWTYDNDLITGGGSELKVVRRNGVTTFAWADTDLHLNDDQTGVGWTEQASPAAGIHQFASSVVFDPQYSGDSGAKMWVIGGLVGNNNNRTDAVYYSNDGATWSSARSNLDINGFGPRDSHASAVFNGKMWVIGGENSTFASGILGDVWSSSDGTNWAQAMSGTNAVDIGGRRSAAAVVFNNNLFVIGGITNNSTYPTYPIEYSSDGVNWSGVSFTPFQRYGLSALVYNGAIYVIGGSGADTRTYKSTDGTNWTLVDVSQSFLNAVGLVFDNKMWMIDGVGANWSTDGVHWTRAGSSSPPFDGRGGMTGVVLPLNGSDKMWILGGYVNLGQSWKDEAWYSS
jgi:hypothetical protein